MTLSEKSSGFLAKAVASLDFPDGSAGKEFSYSAGDTEDAVRYLQKDSLEKEMAKEMATHSSILDWRIPMDRGAWQATAHGVAKSQI